MATNPEPAEGSVPSARIVDWLLTGTRPFGSKPCAISATHRTTKWPRRRPKSLATVGVRCCSKRKTRTAAGAAGCYNPKWTSTTFTLLLLHWLGLPPGHPQAVSGCLRLLDGAEYFDGGISFERHPQRAETASPP